MRVGRSAECCVGMSVAWRGVEVWVWRAVVCPWQEAVGLQGSSAALAQAVEKVLGAISSMPGSRWRLVQILPHLVTI